MRTSDDFTPAADSNQLPPAFDPGFYKKTYRDLSEASDDRAAQHYREHGISEGRAGSAAALRAGLLRLVQAESSILEIGPFNAPAVHGSHVKYLDAFDKPRLIQRAIGYGIDPTNIPEIDYVSPSGSFEMVDRKFSAAFGSHSIEHQPDLIRHLQQVSGILEEGGRYYIICPDKRFCFDHFIAETTPVDVLSAYWLKVDNHQPRSFIAQRLYYTEQTDPSLHWAGDHGKPRHETMDLDADALFAGFPFSKYEDTHAWQFTPRAFFDALSTIHAVGLTDFYPERVFQTPRNTFEFTVILRKGRRTEPASVAFVDSPNLAGDLRGKLNNAEANIAALSNHIATMEKSLSWRATAPLRTLMGVFRRK